MADVYFSLHDVRDVVIEDVAPGTAAGQPPYVVRDVHFRMTDGSMVNIAAFGYGDIPVRSAVEVEAEEAALAASEEE